jgi:PAT family beta-lactamase induction signal transducer AmpG
MASAGVLWIAAAIDATVDTYEHAPWRFAYLVMAASMMVGILSQRLIIREPEVALQSARCQTTRKSPELAIAQMASVIRAPSDLLIWLYGALIAPFRDFIVRHGRQASTHPVD